MEAIARGPTTAAATEGASVAVAYKLSAYGEFRRKHERRRRIIRALVEIAVVVLLWQVMAVSYDLEQLLPPPLAVARTIFNTLTLNYQQPWLYGPNIYEQLGASLARAISGFAIAATVAIPLGLLLGRARAAREYIDPVIRSFIQFQELPGSPLPSCGLASAMRPSSSSL